MRQPLCHSAERGFSHKGLGVKTLPHSDQQAEASGKSLIAAGVKDHMLVECEMV